MYAFVELNNIYCCMKRGVKKKEMLKNFAINKVSEAGINKYRGKKGPNQKVILVEPVES